MKHCIDFEPIDVWFLNNNDKFYDRKLSFGICPMCNKPVAILIQYDIIQDKYVSIKKIGIAADEFVQSFKNQIKFHFMIRHYHNFLIMAHHPKGKQSFR